MQISGRCFCDFCEFPSCTILRLLLFCDSCGVGGIFLAAFTNFAILRIIIYATPSHSMVRETFKSGHGGRPSLRDAGKVGRQHARRTQPARKGQEGGAIFPLHAYRRMLGQEQHQCRYTIQRQCGAETIRNNSHRNRRPARAVSACSGVWYLLRRQQASAPPPGPSGGYWRRGGHLPPPQLPPSFRAKRRTPLKDRDFQNY